MQTPVKVLVLTAEIQGVFRVHRYVNGLRILARNAGCSIKMSAQRRVIRHNIKFSVTGLPARVQKFAETLQLSISKHAS